MKYQVEIHDIQIYTMIVDLDGEDPSVHDDIIMDMLEYDRGKYWTEGSEYIVSMIPLKEETNGN